MAQLMSIKRNVEMCHGQVSVPAIYHVSQGDKGTRIILGLVNNSANYTIPEGTTATIRGHRADGTLFTEITADVETTEVKFNLTEDMSAVPGRAECEAVLASGSANIIGTANFIIDVEKSPASIGSVFPATDAAETWLINQLNNQPINELDGESVVDAINGGSGLTEDIKTALLACFENVAWINDNGQDYYDALYDALYAITAITLNTNSISLQSIGATLQLTATTTPEGGNVTWSSSNTSVATVSATGLITSVAYGSATITATAGSVSATCSVLVAQATCTGITAIYTQSGTVYDTATLDSLKSDLVVTASWSDSTTTTLSANDYTLSGTLEVGTSTITVSYGGQTDTFDVTVTSEEWTVVRTIGDNYETGRVSQSAGTVDASQTSWYTSSFIEVPDGATSYSRDTSRTSDWNLVWYDSEQAFLGNGETGTYSGNAGYGGGYTDGNGVLWNVVPSTAKYCKVSWRTNATYTSVTFAHNNIIDENTTPVVDKLYAYIYNPTATGNSFNNDDFLKCSGMAYAQIRPVQQRSVTFYDSDFLVVSTIQRATNIGNNVAIPSDAVYLKCQCVNNVAISGSSTTRIGTGLIMFTDEIKESW